MAITATQVNELRTQTGLGMMDCKKALTESNGDMQAAIDILRKRGQKVSASRADRNTTEGAVFCSTNEAKSQGIMLSLECETDFVAKNAEFLDLGKKILSVAVNNSAPDKDALMGMDMGGRSIQEILTDYMGKIGEKIEVGNYVMIASQKVVAYIHNGSKLGVLVGLNKAGGENIESAGKDVGMQIAAMNPVAVDSSGVDKSIVQREMEIARDKAKLDGKADNLIEKIAEGMLNRFYKDNTLLAQAFVKDNGVTVKAYLDSVESGLTVTSFQRVAIG